MEQQVEALPAKRTGARYGILLLVCLLLANTGGLLGVIFFKAQITEVSRCHPDLFISMAFWSTMYVMGLGGAMVSTLCAYFACRAQEKGIISSFKRFRQSGEFMAIFSLAMFLLASFGCLKAFAL